MRTLLGLLGATSPVVTPTPTPFSPSCVLPPPLQPAVDPVDPQAAALPVPAEQLGGRAETPGGGGGGPNGLGGGGGVLV